MIENKELLNVQIQYKLIEELKQTNQKLQKRIEKEIALKEEIKEINLNLERNISKQTKENILLSNTINEQELMASIGEVSAGISHDLNTPLGAIKTSAESIRYTLHDFFFNDLQHVSLREFDFAYKRVMKNESINVFLNSSIQRKNTAAFEKILKPLCSKKESIKELSSLFVKARICTNEEKTIKKILESENPESFLILIDKFQKIHSFIDTILLSSDKAGKVVHNLHTFVTNQSKELKEIINLKKNISTLIEIFKHEFKKEIDLNIEIDDELNIMGFESKLFQLWTNLLKNALFAVNQNSGLKIIRIYAVKKEKKIRVTFENNGPKINKEEQKLIFKKFFTTKKKEGTGLGMGIVKSVVNSHQASINLKSNNDKTSFTICFNEVSFSTNNKFQKSDSLSIV